MPDFLIANGQGGVAHGDVASTLLQNKFDANALRPWIDPKTRRSFISVPTYNDEGKLVMKAVPVNNDATLRKDEWKQMDDTVLQIARARMTGIADLESRGLTYSIANGLGTTVLEYEDISDMNPAQMDMDAETEGPYDRVQYGINYLPLPITHKEFRLNVRQLEASRTRGAALDTTQMELSTIKVVESMEGVLFNGSSSYTFGGGTIYGYLDFPSRVTGNLTAAWDGTATGEQVVDDIITMKHALIDKKHYGPFVIYVPKAYARAFDEDFKAGSDKSVRQRAMEVDGIEAIKVSDYMTAGNVIMIEMQASTIRLVTALPIAPVQWDERGGFVKKFKVMGIKVPQLRADQDGNCGLAHYAPA